MQKHYLKARYDVCFAIRHIYIDRGFMFKLYIFISILLSFVWRPGNPSLADIITILHMVL
ncbi:hypothetical protein ACRRTK_000447 [Alexandromys fortis]